MTSLTSLPHYMNGRVLHRPGGGVHRYGREVAARLDDCTTVSPASAERFWSARVWEQTTLHRRSADGVLLSVAHSGPLRHRRQVVVVHDLIALASPSTVKPLFAVSQRMLLPALIKQAAVVAPVSRHVADALMTSFGIGADLVHVVTPGIADVFGPGDREAARVALGLDAERPVVAALLDPTPRKHGSDVSRLLESIAAERGDLQIVVAGGSAPGHLARGRAATVRRPLGARDLGPADDQDLATMYRAADVFVALSSAEGFGLPVIEAAVCGAAVVSTPVPSLVEHGGDAAVLVADVAAARRAVIDLLDAPQRRAELAAKAADLFGDLRWAVTAATLDDLMGSLDDT